MVEPDPGRCDVREVLNRIGDKWTVLVIALLADGPRRFNELRRLAHGITQRMLSVTLRALQRDGLVTRTVTPTVPPRVDYALTDAGQSLAGVVAEVLRWAEDHRRYIHEARSAYDRAAGSG
ncbi:helix-turn-helix domain-containing protein [Nonomuraea sp. NPDC001636]|uniref:winged helix-turn-helix transcriptional regulator n=1 Tax=Nonomuraea sp. NPDC001636 TaxID=3154391 RepID=UPI003323963E